MQNGPADLLYKKQVEYKVNTLLWRTFSLGLFYGAEIGLMTDSEVPILSDLLSDFSQIPTENTGTEALLWFCLGSEPLVSVEKGQKSVEDWKLLPQIDFKVKLENEIWIILYMQRIVNCCETLFISPNAIPVYWSSALVSVGSMATQVIMSHFCFPSSFKFCFWRLG